MRASVFAGALVGLVAVCGASHAAVILDSSGSPYAVQNLGTLSAGSNTPSNNYEFSNLGHRTQEFQFSFTLPTNLTNAPYDVTITETSSPIVVTPPTRRNPGITIPAGITGLTSEVLQLNSQTATASATSGASFTFKGPLALTVDDLTAGEAYTLDVISNYYRNRFIGYLGGGPVDLSIQVSELPSIPPGTPAVPEASTWAMIIIGFLGVGLLGYRRSGGQRALRLV